MKTKPTIIACAVFLIAAFSLFVVFYQSHVRHMGMAQVHDHADIIASSLWTFEESSPTAYLTLAAKANGYERILVRDDKGEMFLDISGPPPTRADEFLLAAHLIPIYQLTSNVEFEGQTIGSISAAWRCRAIYTHFYILFCVFLVLAGLWFFLKLVDANRTLESRVKDRTAELEAENRERKRTEEALRQATLVVESSPAMLFRWKAEEGWPVVLVSENVTQIGYTSEELLSGSIAFSSIVHPNDLARIGDEVQTYSASGVDHFQQEYRIITKDGRVRWVDDRTAIERDAEGRISHYQGIVVDITERKLAERALHESERKFRAVVENAQAIIFVLDKDGVFQLSEGQDLDKLGLRPGQVVGQSAIEIYAAIPSVLEGIRMALNGKTNHTINVFGNVVFDTVYSPYLDSDGQQNGVVGVAIDITERRRAEEALQASEARLRAVIDEAPFGAHTYELHDDDRLVFLGGNRSADRILGIDHSPLIGETLEKAFPGLASTAISESYRRIAVGGESLNTDHIIYEQGQIRGAFEIHAFQTGSNRMAVFFADITERKRAEEARRKYERMVSSTQDLMALVGRDGIYEAVSESVLLAHGQARGEILGRTVSEVMGETVFQEKIRTRLEQALSGQTVRFQDVFEYAGLGRRIMDVSYFPMFDEAGNIEGVVTNGRDITDTRKLEEQLTQSQKIESIGTLAGGVAHEINNPINGIMNYAQLILDRMEEDHPAQGFAQEILHETQRIAKIVRNLLTFARREKQSHSPALLSDIVASVLSLVQTVMRHDQIDLRVEIPDDLPRIKCRSQQIQQVLMNLMTNARDALNERYPGYSSEKKLRVSAEMISKQDRRFIRTTVEDSGAGIPMDVRDRIFDPFFTTKPKETGTGLGLSISYGIVRDHGGELMVETEPGRYTRFHMDLPVDNGWTLTEK
ncbi:MAG TPA: hypothetical protein DCZ69_10025 [Syntrophobacteraceae bacterium]|nr:hypothetical protein [Syntrophobacteraceae bacterium]